MSANPILVYGGWSAFGVPDFSPFCLKVKTYLRMAGLPYEAKLGDPRRAPTKRIPYIQDGDLWVGDSSAIVEYLKKKYGDPLDGTLTAEQRATGHLVRRTLEEHTYWPVLHSRWLVDENFAEIAKLFKGLLPPVIGPLLVNGPIRGSQRKKLQGQGMGAHSLDRIYALACDDLDAVATTLGAKPWLLGDEPSSYDAVVFAFISNALAFPTTSPISLRARSHPNLVAHGERVKEPLLGDAGRPSRTGVKVERQMGNGG